MSFMIVRMTGRAFIAVAVLFMANATAASAQQRPAAPAPPSQPAGTVQVTTPEAVAVPIPEGVIAGRVVDATTKAGVARARVRVAAGCETPSVDDTPCKKVLEHDRTIVADEQGRFRFTQLPAGATFVVRAGATGYAPQGFGELPPGQRPRLIPLKPAEVLEGLTIELAPEVVLAGIVQDEDGKPFSGAFVEAQRATYLDGRREMLTVAEAITDDRGQFRLSQMPPGQYYVSATDPSFSDVGDVSGQLFWPSTYYPSASTPEDATRITLDPGVVQEAIIIKLKLVRPSRVGGRLRPAGNEELTAGAIEMGPRVSDQYASLSNHRVDIKPDGAYMFANVSPGRYAIRARGEAPSLVQSMFGIYTIDVSGTDMVAVDIGMQPGAILSGFVEWEGRARRPADKSGVVIRSPMADGSLSGDAVTGNVQPDDSFKLRGVLFGEHYIRVDGLPEPWTLKRVEIQGRDVTDLAVEFRTGQIEPTVRVILTDASTEVGGTLSVSSRDVLHGYAVVIFSRNPTAWYPRSRHVWLGRPNLRGRFLVRGLPPGEYLMIAVRDVDEGDIGNATALQRLSENPSAKPLTIRQDERMLVDLRAIVKRPMPGQP